MSKVLVCSHFKFYNYVNFVSHLSSLWNPCKYIFFYFQEFECNAEDLREINELGHGAYGYVYKMIHEPTGNIMAVKVSSEV